jgi:hypothetical protein
MTRQGSILNILDRHREPPPPLTITTDMTARGDRHMGRPDVIDAMGKLRLYGMRES